MRQRLRHFMASISSFAQGVERWTSCVGYVVPLSTDLQLLFWFAATAKRKVVELTLGFRAPPMQYGKPPILLCPR